MIQITQLLLLVLVTLSSICSTNAFASKNSWTDRPLVPELAQQPESDDASNTKTTKKWNAGRFISQSSKFISLPKVPLPGMNAQPTIVQPGDTVWSSDSSANNSFKFAPLDDVVMGGVSYSTFENGKWKGNVSESNSGGFIGIRSTPFKAALDMSACQGIEFKIRGGKNKVFKAVVRDSTDFNGVCWTKAFGGGFRIGDEYTVKIKFDELIPTIFARTVPGQVLDKSNIEAFQVAYSKFLFDGDLNPKFELGDFSLDLVELKAF